MNNFDFALLNIGYIEQNRGCTFPNVCSSFFRLFWPIEGRGIVTIDDEPHTLTPGHLYLIPPLVTHHVYNEGPNQHYYIYFTDCSTQIYDHIQQYSYPFEIPITDIDKSIIHHMLSLIPDCTLAEYNPQSYDHPSSTMHRIKMFQQLPLNLQFEIKGLLHVLLAHFTARATPQRPIGDQRIRKALWIINRNLADVPSLDQLADEACMGKGSFIRLFRQHTGFTPTDYIIRRRIMRAQFLFASGTHSVKEVAHLVGYDNISYFGRTFKRIVGMSPLLFAQQNR